MGPLDNPSAFAANLTMMVALSELSQQAVEIESALNLLKTSDEVPEMIVGLADQIDKEWAQINKALSLAATRAACLSGFES